MKKHKVRIKRLPGSQGLPKKVGYFGNVHPVMKYGGLNKFIYENGGGVRGGVRSSLEQSIIGNPDGALNLAPQDNITFNPTGTGMPTNPYEATDPSMINIKTQSAIDEHAERFDEEEEEVTQDFKRKDMRNFDAEAFLNQTNAIGRGVAGFIDRARTSKRERELQENMYAPENIYSSKSSIDKGDYNPNSGMFREDQMGAKRLSRTQRGGVLPKAQDGPPEEYVTVTGYYSGAENPDASDESDDASTYYGQIEKTPTTKRILRSDYNKMIAARDKYKTQQDLLRSKKYGDDDLSFDERGYNVAETNPNYKYSLGVDQVDELNPDYYSSEKEMFDLNKSIMGIDPIDLRGLKGKDIYSVDRNPFGFRQQQLDFTLDDVTYEDCPECPDGTKPGRDPVTNDCLPCPETEEECVCDDGTKKVPVAHPTTGEMVCPCEKEVETEQKLPAQPRNAPYWLQDTIKTTGAFGELAGLKKYLPWAPPVDFEETSAAFVDPTAALAANAEQANIASQAASSFAGPQGTARMSAIQGAGAKGAADLLSRYNQQNVGIANQTEAANVDVRNKEAAQNAAIKKGLYDQTTMANQQFDNSKRQAMRNLGDQYANAITNRFKTDAMNQMYPDYAVDPSVGGRMDYIPSEKKTKLSDPTPYYESCYNKFKDRSIPEATKQILIKECLRSGRTSSSPKMRPDLNTIYGGQQRGGMTPMYIHGGQHNATFGTTNINQILPPGYTEGGFSDDYIPRENRTTSTIGAVPRNEANLEAEGGETIFGDINGDGFPETNRITGPRHAAGGVPLNLPDDTFIYSDYKTGGMKISDPDVLSLFGKSGKKRKGNRKKPAYTPAELAKQYDINKYRALLEDPNSDHITKKTAEMMIENYNMKLGALALAQESSKGFPQGIPMVARPYMQANNINEQELIPPPPQAMQGGQMMQQGQMQMDPNQMMAMQQQQMMQQQQGMMQNGGVTYEVSGVEEQAPQSFYDYALGEREFLLSNPDMWNEDPEMMYEDGTFKFCLDCLNKDYNNPDHLKGIVRLINEGLSEPPHYDLDIFNEKLIEYNIEAPKVMVENIKRRGGWSY